MEELIKKIAEELNLQDSIETKRLLNMIGRNEAIPVEYAEIQDSFSNIYTTTCPTCGETLTFERFSQIARSYSFCYSCGQKLLKKEKNKENV